MLLPAGLGASASLPWGRKGFWGRGDDSLRQVPMAEGWPKADVVAFPPSANTTCLSL